MSGGGGKRQRRRHWLPSVSFAGGITCVRKQFGNVTIDIVKAVTFEFTELDTNLELVSGNATHVYDVPVGEHRDRLVCNDGHRKTGFDFDPVAGGRCFQARYQLFDGFQITGERHA